jgi:flagellin
MSIRVNSQNRSTMSALRNSSKHQNNLQKTMEKLSSGKRINRAADDAAGLAIAQQMGEMLRGLEQGMENVYDGLSLTQVADGAVSQASDNMLRMKELAMTAANGTLNEDQRAAVQQEFDSLKAEVTRIAESTEFNGKKLLDGSAGVLSLQVGIGTGTDSTIDLDLSDIFTAVGLGLSTQNIATLPGPSAQPVLPALDQAQNTLNQGRARLGAVQNRLESTIRANMNYQENLAAANSRIRDVDVAAETSELASAQILQQAAVSILSQTQRMPSMALTLLGI